MGAEAEAPRVLFEVSTTLAFAGRNAVGIVRVEREIAARLRALADPAVCFVLLRDERLQALAPEQLAQALTPPPQHLRTSPAQHPRPATLWQQRAGRFARQLARVLAAVLPARQRDRLRRWRQTRRLPQIAGETITPRPGDVLVLVGLLWNFLDCAALAALRRQSGLAVVTLIHDLIPLRFPAFTGDDRGFYARFFAELAVCSTRILCNSHSTEADVRSFLAASSLPPRPTALLPLGADLPLAADDAAFAGQACAELLASGRFALTVGTIDARKNHALLLDLWTDLAEEADFDLTLVVVGQPGWGAERTIARLRHEGSGSGRVLWFPELGDGALAWLYSRCHVVLFPSFYEGWGLPVTEALAHGRCVIASNRGATPEAAFGAATLLDPEDRAAWRQAILAVARAPRQSITPPPLPSWDETVRVLLAEVKAARDSRST